MNNEQLREAWQNSDVCNELKFNIDGQHRNDEVERRQDDVFNWFATHHRQALERVAGKIESVEFKMNVDEYLPMVENWNRTNFDVPFDHGFAEGKKYALAIIREEI